MLNVIVNTVNIVQQDCNVKNKKSVQPKAFKMILYCKIQNQSILYSLKLFNFNEICLCQRLTNAEMCQNKIFHCYLLVYRVVVKMNVTPKIFMTRISVRFLFSNVKQLHFNFDISIQFSSIQFHSDSFQTSIPKIS